MQKHVLIRAKGKGRRRRDPRSDDGGGEHGRVFVAARGAKESVGACG